MRLADTRPPFAGLANLSEAALAALPTPCYLLDEARLRRNGEILLGVQQRTGCKILLAQKAFSNYDLYPVLAPYLAGTEDPRRAELENCFLISDKARCIAGSVLELITAACWN